MKKLLAAFAVLAASTMAQAQTQTLPAHPDARNDRVLVEERAERATQYRRADHRRMKHHHRKHHRNHRHHG